MDDNASVCSTSVIIKPKIIPSSLSVILAIKVQSHALRIKQPENTNDPTRRSYRRITPSGISTNFLSPKL